MIFLRSAAIFLFAVFCIHLNAADLEIEYLTAFEQVKDEAQKRIEIFRELGEKYNQHPDQREVTVFRRDIDRAGANFNAIRHPLVKKYAWAIPNEEALETINSFGPIFELGAGGGYWAKLLRERGTDVIAVDNHNDKNTPLEPSTLWTTVLEGDERMIESYPEHTLFICWPDPRTRAGGRALEKYKGKYVLYVGYDAAKISPWMGDVEFYKAISTQFKLIKTVIIPTWQLNDDKLYVFERL